MTEDTKHKQIHWWSLLAVVLILLASGYFLRLYPVALVGAKLISAADFDQAYKLAKQIDSTASKQQVFDQLILNTQKAALVSKLRIDLDDAVPKEANFYKSNQTQYSQTLISFNNNENLFSKFVVEPQAMDALLRIKYNQDFSKNNQAYNQATSILDKINHGENFDDLAKVYSDDKVSGQLNGDLGFVSEGEFLPELQNAVEHTVVGQIDKQIVISRLGYHILYPIDETTKGATKVWHLKHIFIKTSGYENWLSDQLKSISVKKLIGV